MSASNIFDGLVDWVVKKRAENLLNAEDGFSIKIGTLHISKNDFKNIYLENGESEKLRNKAKILFGASCLVFFTILFLLIKDWFYGKGAFVEILIPSLAIGLFIFFSAFVLLFVVITNENILNAYRNSYNEQHGRRSRIELEKRNKLDAQRNLELAEKNRLAKERRAYLQNIEDVEAAKSRGKAKGLAELYKTQIELMIKYKREGVNIENDIYEMRKRLLSLEREENNVMVQDLLQTLDRI